jgi:putative sterol carrier protein
MTISDDAFPSTRAFDLIEEGLKQDDLRKKFIKQTNAVIQFTLKNNEGKEESWYLDLKKEGKIAKGPAPKADITLIVSDTHFGQLVEGKANAQKLFMSGKLKVKGNVMKAASIEGVLKSARAEAKL